MIPSRFALLACFLLPSVSLAQTPAALGGLGTFSVSYDKEEFEKRMLEAGDDVEKLWQVHNYCVTYNLSSEDRKVLRAIIKLDPDHKQAREASGHIYFDDQWFKSEKKYLSHKAKLEAAEAKAAGLVKYKGEWVHPDDVEKLKAGLRKTEDGQWLSEEEFERISKGYVLHDLMWISPEEVVEADAGKFKCGEDWLDLEQANKYHKLTDRFWKIPSYDNRFHIFATTDREVALKALDQASETIPDIVRILGKVPSEPVVFGLLRTAKQYGSYAAGDSAFNVPATELRGLSSIHGAYFAEVWFTEDSDHMGAGVAYWDASSDSGNMFGKLFARHAAALSIVEALDPSPKVMERTKKTRDFDIEAFLDEKKLPDWLRFGTASYCERYYLDKARNADPIALRKWSVSNIKSRGAFDSLSTIFKMKLTVDDPDQSGKLLNEAGLVVAFLIDGDNAEVKAKHAAFKIAFRNGGSIEKETRALEAALLDAEADLRKFGDV
ncbi:MAG: hypothetical protein ACI8Q9_000732 [Planctomycetota bacterium]|jgi:hypothetical protein